MSQLSRSDIRAWIEGVDADVSYTLHLGAYHPSLWGNYSAALAGDLGAFRALGQLAIQYAEQLGHDITRPAIKTNETKGADYTGSSHDPLQNFYKVMGKLIESGYECADALAVWGVYVAKHLDAIETFEQTGRVASEPIESRLMDVLVYSALGYFIMARMKGIQHVTYTHRPAGQLGAAATPGN